MANHGDVQNACGCRPMRPPNPPIASDNSANTLPANGITDGAKYFQEIGAEMIGNQLIIRVEKDKNKSKHKVGQWDPPCDCVIPEIRMPSSTEGPRIVNAGDNNQILFRIHSRTLVGKDDANYKPEAFAYQLGAAKKGKDSSDQYRTITVHPQLSDQSQSQEVHSDHISDGNQNIYLLRIKKKGEAAGQRKRNIELELRTPKPPTPRPVSTIPVQKSQLPISPEPSVEVKTNKVEMANGRKKSDDVKKKKKK